MRVRWFGQSSYLLTGERSVFIDPFGDMSGAAARGVEWNYPPIEGIEADVLLVTHEHGDHNAVEAIAGDPVVIRSRAGKFDSPVGEVVGVASEHDGAAGTQRGPNTIFCFTLDGLRICHLGDFGQPALRPEQLAAIGEVDVLFVPAGSGPTTGGSAAAELVRAVRPRLVVPMHYRTEAIGFLEPPDAFLDALGGDIRRVDESELDADANLGSREAPVTAVLAAPRTS